MDFKKILKNNELNYFISRKFKQNATIFHEGDQCKYIGFVSSGKVSISSYSFQGDEIIYKTVEKGDGFGMSLLFSSEPIYKGNVISKTACEILFIDKQNLLALMSQNKVFLSEYLKIEADNNVLLHDQVRLYCYDGAEERFLFYLYMNKNCIEFKNITQLANVLNLRRETLSRVVNKLIDQKKIKIEDSKIQLL